MNSKHSFWFTLVSFGVIIAALQLAGGAYQAEFDAHADESSHLVSTLLVHDYMAHWPWPNPIPWALQYYIHYPKVAIGQWPPGYYIIQGLWWLIVPPSRASAMWLNWIFAVACLALFLSLARRIRGTAPAIAAGLALIALPVMQQATTQVMAELPSLLFALLLLFSLTRLVEQPGVRWLSAAAVSLLAAIGIKGTGMALLLAPVFVIVIDSQWRHFRWRYLIGVPAVGGALLAAAFLWQYRSFARLSVWAGMTFSVPWGAALLLDLVGAGVLLLAAAGAAAAWRARHPVAVAAFSIVLSMLCVSFFVRAMREPRHWIAAAPALLLLALYGGDWMARRSRWGAAVAALIALLPFPYEFYRQSPAGWTDLARQIPRPARMLISSPLGWREGPWVAVTALTEKRPASTVVRANKLLAKSDWNGNRYRLLTHTAAEIEQKLDETAIGVVILDNAPVPPHLNPSIRPHHTLLSTTIAGHPAWKPCASSGGFVAYCRQLPPRFPRVPIRVNLQDRFGLIAEEAPGPS